MEDYGSPATEQGMEGTQRPADSAGERHGGGYSGGTEGVQEGNSEGLQFGEYRDTGTGIDLTRSMETHPLPPEDTEPGGSRDRDLDLIDEMQPNDLNPRTGRVKGGEHGQDEAGGPARYGGDAGSLGPDQADRTPD
jgi:hypothetical protein